jgi:hypothetical protein
MRTGKERGCVIIALKRISIGFTRPMGTGEQYPVSIEIESATNKE